MLEEVFELNMALEELRQATIGQPRLEAAQSSFWRMLRKRCRARELISRRTTRANREASGKIRALLNRRRYIREPDQ